MRRRPAARATRPAPGGRKLPVLHIYNWADYIGHGTIAEFERKTHIKVIYALYDSNETLEAKMLAGSSGYDIVSTTTGFYGRQIKAGAYLPLDKSKLPNWKNLDPAVLAMQSQADPGNRYASALSACHERLRRTTWIRSRRACRMRPPTAWPCCSIPR
jgi:putrescine transport system substrate-binding protein